MQSKDPIDEDWLFLILEAKNLGLSMNDIRHFLDQQEHTSIVNNDNNQKTF